MNNRIVTTNLREQIYQILYDLILERSILPGEKILEEDLAKKIGVSRTPIRECLCRLENEGLVEIIPRRGAFLKKYSRKKVQEIFEMREVLEGLVARLVASVSNDDTIQRIKNILDRVYQLPDQEEYLSEFTRAGVEFHAFLLESCNNEMLQNAMAVINAHLRITRPLTVVIPGRARLTVEEHYHILEALEMQDPEVAEKRMREHVVSVREHALDSLDFTD